MPTTLRAALPGDFRPFGWRGLDGKLRGHDVELLELLAHETHLHLEWVPASWGTLTELLESGAADLACGGITMTPDRDAAARPLPAYAPFWKTALVRRAELERWTNVADLNRPAVRVIKNPGGTNERWVDENLPRARVTLHSVNEEIPGMIAEGEGDVMVTDTSEALWYAKRDARLAVAPLQLTPVEWKALYVAKGSPLYEPLRDAWMRLHYAGELATLARRWEL